MVESQPLAEYLDWINFKYFCTFTTRLPIGLNSTRRLAETVANKIKAGSQSTMFWCAEPFDVREGFHFHALIRTPWTQKEIKQWYEPKWGRCDLIDNTRSNRGRAASFYCAKYLQKHLSDYDIYFEDDLKKRNQHNVEYTNLNVTIEPEHRKLGT